MVAATAGRRPFVPPTPCLAAAVVCYGEVARAAQALRGQGCRVVVTEIDPISPGGDGGLRGQDHDEVIATADIFITATGNKDIITAATWQR